jgi:hypothetical protein
MWLELTNSGDGTPILINTHWVGHWFPNDDGVLVEMAYVWTSDPPTARTIQVTQPYGAIYQALRHHQKEPGAVETLHVRRRRRRPDEAQ